MIYFYDDYMTCKYSLSVTSASSSLGEILCAPNTADIRQKLHIPQDLKEPGVFLS